MEPVLNFINGTFVQAKSSRTLDDVNPATGETITTVARSNSEDVNEAAKAAMEAAPTWSQTTMEERIEWLNCIADALEAEAETIAQLESLDTGKPITLARNVDAARSVANFRFFASFASQQAEQTFSDHGAVNHVHRSPVGCVGLITPWNLPLYLLSWKVAPALLMGNTIVAKPSELTPLTANFLAKTLQSIGLPPACSTWFTDTVTRWVRPSLSTKTSEACRSQVARPPGKSWQQPPPRCSRNSPLSWAEKMRPCCWTTPRLTTSCRALFARRLPTPAKYAFAVRVFSFTHQFTMNS